MKKIILAVIFLIASSGLVLANNGWYSTLQGTASDVEQTPPPNGVTIAYNTTDHQWEFNYGLAPAGGTTGTCLEKNSNSDYDYSWVTCSGGGGTPGGSNTQVQYNSSGSFAANSGFVYNGTNVGIGSITPGQALDVQGTVRATGFVAGTAGIISEGGLGAELINKGYDLTILSPLTTGGGGEVGSTLVYNNLLYIGYYNSSTSCPLYSWNGTTLTLVKNFGTGTHFETVASLASYQGKLYAGIEGLNTGDGDVYVSSDSGATWTKSLDEATQDFAWALQVFKGKLYVGQGYSASVIKKFDGTTWTTSSSGVSGAGLVDNFAVYKGLLFAFLGSSGGGGNSAIESTPDGVTWTVEASYPKTVYNQIQSGVEFNGHLYATVLNNGGGTNDLLIRNDATGTWSVQKSSLDAGSQCNSSAVYNNALYIGCTDSGGPNIYKSYDGFNFTLDNQLVGTSGATEAFRMANYDGSLYIGLGYSSYTQADMWRKIDSLGQQSDWWSTFLNKFRQNTNNGYNGTNDSSLLSVTTPISFDSNVGIATIFPTQALDVNGTVRTVGFTMPSGASNTYVLTSDANGNGTWQPASGGGGSNYWQLGNVGINTTNNVGIGSVNPGQALDVNGTIRSLALQINPAGSTTSNPSILGITGFSTGQAAQLRFGDNNNVIQNGFGTDMDISAYHAIRIFGNHQNSAPGYASGYNSDAAVTIQSPGSPYPDALDITNSGGSLKSEFNNTGNLGLNVTAPMNYLDVNGAEALGSYAGNNVAPSNGLIVSGNVGIGTWVPGGNLDVGTGSVCINHVCNSSWPAAGVSSVSGDSFFINNSSSVGAVTLTKATHTQNTVIGAATSTTPADLTMPSCSSGSNALTWTTNTGFGCNTISGSGTNYWNYSGSGNIGVSTANAVGIGTTFIGGTGEAMLSVINGNVGIGTWVPAQLLQVNGSIQVGTGKAVITGDANGNVGIGSTNPGQTLDVSGTVRMTGFVDTTNPTNNYVLTSDANGNGTWKVSAGGGSNYWLLGSGNVGIATFGAGNNVGIGTVTPGTLLDVQGTAGNLVNLRNGATSEMSVSSSGNIIANGTLTTGSTGQSTYGYGLVVNSGGNSSASGGDFEVLNNVGIGTFYVSATTGNVGIGTVNPGTLLDVNGTGIRLDNYTTNAILCITTTHVLGHCTSSASCTSTCTCTCTAG